MGQPLAPPAVGRVPAGGTPLGWTTVMDVDFSAQPNQALGVDGPVVIAGTNFTKVNSANEAAPTALVNGQGIIIQPAGATDYFAGTFSLPGLRWNLAQVPRMYLTLPVRMWLRFTAANLTANFDALTMGIEATNGGTPASDSLLKRAFDGGQKFLSATNTNGANNFQVIDGQHLGDDVLIVEHPDGIPSAVSKTFSGLFAAGDWPDFSVCNGHAIMNAPIENISLDTPAGPFQPIAPAGPSSGWNAFFGASRSGSPTALSITIARMKLEVKYP